MEFSNIEQIKQEFGLTTSDPKELKKQLRKIMAELHPDTNDGAFDSAAQELFLKADAAIDFLDAQLEPGTAIIPISDLTALTKAVTELARTESRTSSRLIKEESSRALLTTEMRRIEKRVHTKYMAPKLTASVVAGIMSIVWVFPQLIQEHPILSASPILGSSTFLMFWLLSLVTTSALWVFAYSAENRQRYLHSKVQTEGYQNSLFASFLFSRGGNVVEVEELNDDGNLSLYYVFFKDDFVEFIQLKPRRSFLHFYIKDLTSPEIDPELAQTIVDVILDRVEGLGIIQKYQTETSFSQEYRIEANVYEEHRYRYTRQMPER